MKSPSCASRAECNARVCLGLSISRNTLQGGENGIAGPIQSNPITSGGNYLRIVQAGTSSLDTVTLGLHLSNCRSHHQRSTLAWPWRAIHPRLARSGYVSYITSISDFPDSTIPGSRHSKRPYSLRLGLKFETILHKSAA